MIRSTCKCCADTTKPLKKISIKNTRKKSSADFSTHAPRHHLAFEKSGPAHIIHPLALQLQVLRCTLRDQSDETTLRNQTIPPIKSSQTQAPSRQEAIAKWAARRSRARRPPRRRPRLSSCPALLRAPRWGRRCGGRWSSRRRWWPAACSNTACRWSPSCSPGTSASSRSPAPPSPPPLPT